MEKGILPVSRYDCRVRLLMPKRLHTAFVVEPLLGLGRITDEFFHTMDKVCKFGAMSLPRFAVDDNEFHCLNFVLITLLLLSKQTVMQSIAVLLGCKSNPSEAPLQEMRISREIERKQ